MPGISHCRSDFSDQGAGQSYRFPWALLGILWLATLLCYRHLADDSLWLDEIYTVWTARLPWSEIPAAAIASGSQAPLWFWISHPFVVDGTAEEFLLRFPAALAGVVTVAATYALGRELFGHNAAFWGACLVTLAPLMARYNQEARMYSALAAATLLSARFWWRYIHRWRWRDGLGFVVSTAAALYLSYFALFSIVAEIVFAVTMLWLPPSSKPGEAPVWRRLKRMALVWSGVVLLFLPWAVMALSPFLHHQSSLAQSVAGWRITLSGAFLLRLFNQLLGGPTLALLLGLSFVGSMTLLLRKQQWPAAVLAATWVAVPWLVVIFLQPRRFYVRYMIMLQPMIALVAGAGLQWLSQAAINWRGWRWPLRQRTALVVSLLVGGIVLTHLGPLMNAYAQENEDWRGLAAYLAREAAPGAVVLCHGEAPGQGGDEGRVRIGLEHYLPRWGREDIQLIGVDAVEEIAQRSLAGRQLWGVLWHHAPLGQPSLPTGWEEVEFAQVLVVEAPVTASPASLNEMLNLFLLYLPADAPRYHTGLALAKVAALAGDTAAARGYLDAASRIRPGGSYADRAWEQASRIVEGTP
jgi:4-amino-4-deoxy-L-arabinose transferase-like glycosyltransferase